LGICLKDIRQWRQAELGEKLGWVLDFPLFEREYASLQEILWASKATARISAVTAKGQSAVHVGQIFDRTLVEKLQQEGCIDAFGENGEFHTLVTFEDMNFFDSA